MSNFPCRALRVLVANERMQQTLVFTVIWHGCQNAHELLSLDGAINRNSAWQNKRIGNTCLQFKDEDTVASKMFWLFLYSTRSFNICCTDGDVKIVSPLNLSLFVPSTTQLIGKRFLWNECVMRKNKSTNSSHNLSSCSVNPTLYESNIFVRAQLLSNEDYVLLNFCITSFIMT